MKKIITLTLAALFLIACGNKENTSSTDALIDAKNIKGLKEKRVSLQAELSKIDAALADMDSIKEEVLVEVAPVMDTTFSHYVEVQGNVVTRENILIQPEFSGTLTALNVKVGQRVSKGQVLGRVDDAGMGQQLAQVQTQYELAKTTYERQKRLWEQKIGSEIQYLQAQTQMISLQKQVNQMRAQLAKTVIKAPFTGVIDEVFVERGQVVAPSQQGLMRIVNLSNMYVTASVPESNIGKVKVGTEVEVFIASINKTIKGKVRQAANYINPNNRSFDIEVAVSNADNLLRPNQVAKLKIVDYTKANTMVVPANIVQEDAKGNKYVYLVANSDGKTGIAKKAIVKIGQTANNQTEILDGLTSKDIVVTEGANTVSEGMKLNF
nr:efflux RND transporter periplasmic adaptor subunit [uncultured Flavobacterium sp.]